MTAMLDGVLAVPLRENPLLIRSGTGSTVSRCNGGERPEHMAQLSQSSFVQGLRHDENWLWFPGQLVKAGNGVNGVAQNCHSV